MDGGGGWGTRKAEVILAVDICWEGEISYLQGLCGCLDETPGKHCAHGATQSPMAVLVLCMN